MDENYDNNEDDEEYDDDYYNYDYNDQYDPYKFYFKFDLDSNSSVSDWIQDMINNIFKSPIENINQFPVVQFPVNSYFPNTENEPKNPFLYLGNNYQNQPIWKNKYFVKDEIHTEYKNHLASHASHFVKQPTYYKGLFDILN